MFIKKNDLFVLKRRRENENETVVFEKVCRFVNEKNALTSFNDDLLLTTVNDNPYLTIFNNKWILLKKIEINCYKSQIFFPKRSFLVFKKFKAIVFISKNVTIVFFLLFFDRFWERFQNYQNKLNKLNFSRNKNEMTLCERTRILFSK